MLVSEDPSCVVLGSARASAQVTAWKCSQMRGRGEDHWVRTALGYRTAAHMAPDSETGAASTLSATPSVLWHTLLVSPLTRGLRASSLPVHVARELLSLIFTEVLYSKTYEQLKAYQEAIPWDFVWFTNGISNSVHEFKCIYRKRFYVVLVEICESVHVPFSKLD